MVQKDEGEVGFPCPGGDDGERAHLSGMLLKRDLLTNLAFPSPTPDREVTGLGEIITIEG